MTAASCAKAWKNVKIKSYDTPNKAGINNWHKCQFLFAECTILKSVSNFSQYSGSLTISIQPLYPCWSHDGCAKGKYVFDMDGAAQQLSEFVRSHFVVDFYSTAGSDKSFFILKLCNHFHICNWKGSKLQLSIIHNFCGGNDCIENHSSYWQILPPAGSIMISIALWFLHWRGGRLVGQNGEMRKTIFKENNFIK